MAINNEIKMGDSYSFLIEATEGNNPRPPAHEPPGKKKRGLLRIISLCLCFALLGGLIGGSVVYQRYALDAPASQEDEPPQLSTAANSATNKRSGAPLTASQVYEKGVISCVSISSVVTERMYGNPFTSTVSGSGFIISEVGHIITNYHVINGADTNKISVTLYDGKTYEAKVIGYDEDNDLAVLRINESGLTPVSLGSSDDLVVGSPIYAIGDPLGTLNFSMTAGIVSGLYRVISTDNSRDINTFQIDAAVNTGNSGGPVFNSYGEVVGIVTAKYADAGVEGLGFAIPIDDVRYMVNDIIDVGYVRSKPYIGITVTSATVAEHSVAGALVHSVERGSAADHAGIKEGDIIVEMGNRKISSLQDLLSARARHRAGDTVELRVYRDGSYLDISLIFDAKPQV